MTPPEGMYDGIDWADVDGGYEPPPEDADGTVRTSVQDQERQAVEPDQFWKTRPILEHIHDFARARRVGPWAVLGATLTRVVAATPPRAQIPPTIGSNASLNMFVGLVGNSGDGKDIAQKVARDALKIEDEPFRTNPLGSGEGLSHMFMKPPGKGEGDEPVQYNSAALVTIGEIDTMGALVQRQSSTIASQLRQAAMGEALGFFYVDQAKRMIVPEHSYRCCLIAGIQPARSAVLLDDADGGTPQRMVWLPAGDPEAPDLAPQQPDQYLWKAPEWIYALRGSNDSYLIQLPEVTKQTITTTRLKRLRGEGDALDGHAVLTRVKVAAALAILDGRHTVNDEDWDLAGTVMAVSDAQRARCQKALLATKIDANKAQAHAEVEKILVIEDRMAREKLPKVAGTIRRRLARAGAEGLTKGLTKNALAAKDREWFEQAIDSLILSGDVVERDGRCYLAST